MPSSAVFHKFKHGQLRSGGPNGPVVKSRAQMLAIYESEKKNEQETGSPDRPRKHMKPRKSR
jgi:hypothetical protein